MALVAPEPEIAAAPVSGLAARVTSRGDTTVLTVRSAAGVVGVVELPAAPDVRAARAAAAGYRRLTWQEIDVAAGRITCRLHGVGHRLPLDRPVSVSAALALAEDGLPTLVHVDGGR